jgi:hypothetical protein
MEYEKQMRLVKKLVEMTNAGAIDWKPSLNSNTFQVSFRDNTLRITTKPSDTTADPDIEIQLLNGNGELVERFTDVDLQNEDNSEPAKWFKNMNSLYKVAQRTALGAEKILDEIISDLDAVMPF